MSYAEKTIFPFPFTLNGIWSWWQFSFQFSEPNGTQFGSKSKGNLSPKSYPIQCERKWKYSFLSVSRQADSKMSSEMLVPLGTMGAQLTVTPRALKRYMVPRGFRGPLIGAWDTSPSRTIEYSSIDYTSARAPSWMNQASQQLLCKISQPKTFKRLTEKKN